MMKHRLTGADVKCYLTEAATGVVEQHTIGDVYAGKRISVFGEIHFKGYGKIQHVDVVNVTFLKSRGALPSVDDILDENFTDGLSSGEYLARLRDGRLT